MYIVIAVILLIAAVLLALYVQYKQNEDSREETRQGVASVTFQLKKLSESISKMGNRFIYKHDNTIAELLSSSVWTTVTFEKKGFAIEPLIISIMDSTPYFVGLEVKSETGDYFEGDRHYVQISPESDGDISQVVVLEMRYRKVPVDLIIDHKSTGFEVDGALAVCTDLKVHIPKDCQGSCPTDTVGLIQKVVKDIPTVKYEFSRGGKNLLRYQVYNSGGDGSWTYTSRELIPLTPKVLGLSYSNLVSGLLGNRISVSKLLEIFPKNWAKTRANLVLFGPANSGKSRLLLALMQAASEEGVSVATVTGLNIQHLLTSNKLLNFINSAPNGAVLFIDEANSIPDTVFGALNGLMEGLESNPKFSIVLCSNAELFDASTIRPGRVQAIVNIGAIQKKEATDLYKELKDTQADYVWQPLPAQETFLLGEIYALGQEKDLAEMLIAPPSL
jgi:hypothetical protein